MSSIDVPDDPLGRFSISVFAMNGALLRSGERVTRPLGQSSARWQVLGRAGYRPRTVVQRIADALADEGLVAYRDNPADRRARLVGLTPAGETVLAAISARNREWSRALLARIDPAQLTQVAEALEGIARIFDDDMDQRPAMEEDEA